MHVCECSHGCTDVPSTLFETIHPLSAEFEQEVKIYYY